MKFLVGSGCCPLKMRKARPAMKPAKIKVLMSGEASRLRNNSLRERRRRILREARRRLMARRGCRKSNMAVLGGRRVVRGTMSLIGVDDSTNQLVPYHIALVEINDRNSDRVFERMQRLD